MKSRFILVRDKWRELKKQFSKPMADIGTLSNTLLILDDLPLTEMRLIVTNKNL